MKLLVKLIKSTTEIFHLLQEVYGDKHLPWTQVFDWVKRFKKGREYVADYSCLGHPWTSKSNEIIVNVAKIIWENHCFSISAVS